MLRGLIILVSIFLIQNLQALAIEEEVVMPNIFIYTLDDEPDEIEEENPILKIKNKLKHKSKTETYEQTEETNEENSQDEEEVVLNMTILKGYAQYVESNDAINFIANDDHALNLKIPQKMNSENLNFRFNNQKKISEVSSFAKYKDFEHRVIDETYSSSGKSNDIIFGTQFENEISQLSMIENSTSIFTKYEKTKFTLGTSFKKTRNSTTNRYSDAIYLAPEYQINNYLKYKQVLSADLTRDRQSNEFVLSISPFGYKKQERFLFEIGAKQTIMGEEQPLRTQFNFKTKFQL
ncbi:MAG: hypothetical protein R3Y28_01640 [Candidatus Gastranaerophilales bacterium]